MSNGITVDGKARGKLIKGIRLQLGADMNESLSQARFGAIVADSIGDPGRFNQSTVARWEDGSREPGIVAGCAIARLGKRPAEALVFVDAATPVAEQLAGKPPVTYNPPPLTPGEIGHREQMERIAGERAAKQQPPAPARKQGGRRDRG